MHDPDCTYPAPPRIPREAWPEHPRWPSQVLLLGSHENFRRVSQFLLDQVDEGVGLTPLALLYNRWKGAMHSHEHYEEHKLFVYLAERYHTSTEPLSDGHDRLRQDDKQVRAAFRTALEADEAAVATSRRALWAALHRHHVTLVEHLREEEDTVIPMLLELGPEEFAEYVAHSIGHLLDDLEESPQPCLECGAPAA